MSSALLVSHSAGRLLGNRPVAYIPIAFPDNLLQLFLKFDIWSRLKSTDVSGKVRLDFLDTFDLGKIVSHGNGTGLSHHTGKIDFKCPGSWNRLLSGFD